MDTTCINVALIDAASISTSISTGKIREICELSADGADIDYEYRYVKDEEEITTTTLIQAVVGAMRRLLEC